MPLETRIIFPQSNDEIRFSLIGIFVSLSSFIFLIYHIYHVEWLFFLGLVPFFVFFFFLSDKEIIISLAFFIPNLFMFKKQGAPNALLGYFLALASLKYIYYNLLNIKINIFLIIHLFTVSLTCILYNDSALFLSACRFILSFFFINEIVLSFKNKDIDATMEMYILGTVVAIITAIIYHQYNGSLYNGFFAGIKCERNYFSASVVPIFVIITYYIMEKKCKFKDYLFYCIAFFIGLLSNFLGASRTAFLSLSVPLFLYILYFFKSDLDFQRIKKIVILGIIIVMIAIELNHYYADLIDNLLERLKDKDMATANNRTVLWDYYFSQATRNFQTIIMGNGASYIKGFSVEHNTYIQCFYQLGLLGCFSLAGIFFSFFGKCLPSKTSMDVVKYFFLLAIVLFFFFSISGLYSETLTFLLVLSGLIVKRFAQNKKV